jgi:hypothetical protein
MIKKKQINVILLLIIFALVLCTPVNIKAIERDEAYNIIYKYDDFESKSLILKTYNSIDLSSYDFIDINYIDDKTLILDFDSIEKTIKCYDLLKDDPSIEYIEPDIYIDLSEDEPVGNSEENTINYISWGVERLGIDKYAKYIKDENKENIVTIAVIDTGIDYNHSIFKDKLLYSGYDFINNDDDPYDDNLQGHGTHVAGIIADSTRELDNIKILPIKALNSLGTGTISSLGNSIRYAIDSNVDIINLSLGLANRTHSNLIEELILEAVNSGITVVNAAGNSNSNTMYSCPSHIDEAIIVSSIDNNNNKAYTSNYGPNIDVAAPGVNIYSSIPGDNYAYKSGTSMAAPYISAIAAMIKLNNPELEPLEIENIIKEYSVDIGEKGVDWYFGSGVPNMALALPKVDLENIEIDNNEITLDVGNSFNLNIKFYPENFINDSEVQWESSNNEIATVDNGQVLAIKEGEAIIKATILDKTAFCKVTVNSTLALDIKEESLNLDISNQEYLSENNDSAEIEEKIKEENIAKNKIPTEKELKEEKIEEDKATIEKELEKEAIKEDKIKTEKELEKDYIVLSGDMLDSNDSYESEKIEYIVNNDVSENNLNASAEKNNYNDDNDNNEIANSYTENIDNNISENENIEVNNIEENVNIVKYNTNKSMLFILIGLFSCVVLFIKNKAYK